MKRANLPRRILATGLAICAHLVVLLLLVWRVPLLLKISRSKDGSAAIELTLIRPEAPHRAPVQARTVRAAPTPPQAPPRVLTAPSADAPPVIAPPATPAPVPPNVEGAPNDEHLRNALRGLIGCTSQTTMRLSSEERAACDRRLAAAAPAAVGSQLTAKEIAAFNADKQESIFTRKPVNGCLPRLGEHPQQGLAGGAGAPQSAGGRSHSAAASTAVGVACAWSF